MTCQRCQGLLIQESHHGWQHWRCVCCGDHFDHLVLANRYSSRPPAWMVAERLLFELRGSPA